MKKFVCIILCTAVLSACGGGGGSGSGGAAPPEVTAAAGIYQGSLQDGSGSDSLSALIDAEGQGYVVYTSSDGSGQAVYRISGLSASGTGLEGTFVAYAFGTTSFPGGKPTDTGSFSATVVPASSISGNLTLDGASGGSSFNLQYDKSDYEQPATIATIAGNYTGTLASGAGSTGDFTSLTVDASGSWSGKDAKGCTFSGAVTIPDASRNAYALDGVANCAGMQTRITGVATNNASPPLIALGLSRTLEVEFGDGASLLWIGSVSPQ